MDTYCCMRRSDWYHVPEQYLPNYDGELLDASLTKTLEHQNAVAEFKWDKTYTGNYHE